MGQFSNLSWIAVDWGTSRLRVWLMGDDFSILDKRTSGCGMGGLSRTQFEPALLELIGDALPEGRKTPVLCCGMAGSRQGWAEAPYFEAPCKPPSMQEAMPVVAVDQRIRVFIVPGVKQMSPADVMRGEETQIAGFLAGNPKFDGVLCLPGTHSKWVRISAEEIVSFQTFMTGEMFSVLSRNSVLRHSVGQVGWDDTAFVSAVDDAMARPASIASQLFGLRADSLLNGLSPDTARARLSGFLIGLELAAARPYWLGQMVAIVGAPDVADVYREGLIAQGLAAEVCDAEAMTLAGLAAAYKDLKERA